MAQVRNDNHHEKKKWPVSDDLGLRSWPRHSEHIITRKLLPLS